VILVFGGGGQIGQELAQMAAQKRLPLLALPRAEADICDANAVEEQLATHRPQLVVNAAAYTNVDRAEDESDEAVRCNTEGPAKVAAACAAARIPLVHISTDYVFDGSKPTAYQETDTVAPLGVYGRSKAAGESAVRQACPNHIILRTAWVYGEFGRNFLKTILRLAKEHDELRIVADQRGCPTSTRDLASAILTVAPRLASESAPWGTYHYSGSGITTWHGFADRIVETQARFTQRRPKVIAIPTKDYPTKAARPANSALDSSLFMRVFGIRPANWTDESTAITCALLQG
jgi:dTDP-4-dehydrorhamnose reductase